MFDRQRHTSWTAMAGAALLAASLASCASKERAYSNTESLNTLKTGEATSWEDRASGDTGKTRIIHTYTDQQGRECKMYVQNVTTSDGMVERQSTACRAPGETNWTIVR
jgi:hypothetical protein